ncbi:winged helix-turn-helix domain-containing protein [Acidobacterium capsulatum]|uniref:Putative transcriptional regulatory protein n=1 Tax=Acidobacterium capsulatum (strain ATCC 51196 / DSM 11244 / BCRC 80197 / JCM 7670 / NBRC 15755 / NCIMB 13165 / 161) TaxID=240015 RepID=C1F5C9_ACIC5|nr:winged helix-turn-helix domain-containing protein [Acidobacterium capsulatum]ACO33397.1 putative transcriptional regulatory protein [Acidobacterium capsulatum ATCC 51196]
MEPQEPTVFSFAAYLYDAENRRLTRNQVPIRINRQMLDLLDLLVRSSGRLVTREQIQKTLWPGQFLDNSEKRITNAVARLRHILGDNSSRPRYIESVPRTGYRLIAPIRVVELARGARPAPAALLPPAVETAVPAEGLPEVLPDAPSALSGTTATADSPSLSEDREAQTRSAGLLQPPGSASAPISGLPRALGRRGVFYAAGVLLLLAGMLAMAPRLKRRPAAAPAEITLGIAPFQASGPGAASLAQSFRLDLTDTLSQLPHLDVRASNSLDLLNLDRSTFRAQATHLGLDVLILGSFTLQNNECHVQLELVRGNDLSHIASFNRTVSRYELADLRTMIQDEVYRSLKLSPVSGGLPTTPIDGTSNPLAYDAYLRAQYHFSQLTGNSLVLAVAEYNEAIADDPNFVDAYAGQARAYIFLVQNDRIGESEGYTLARQAARHALALDAHTAEAHADLGFIYFLQSWNLKAGERELRQAISANPDDPFYHQGLALIYSDEGRFHEAEAQINQALAVDPYWVSAYITDIHIASVAQDRSRVESDIRKIMQLAPNSTHARDGIANAEWSLGLHLRAIQTWREMAVMDHTPSRIAMEDRGLAAYRRGGVAAYARIRIEAIREGMKTAPHGNDFFPPEWYAQAGETQQALRAIRASIAMHDDGVPGMTVLPAYDSLHSNPEFRALLAGVGLNIPARAHS